MNDEDERAAIRGEHTNGLAAALYVDPRIDELRDPMAEDESDGKIAILYGAQLAEPLPPLEYLVADLGLVAGGGAPHLVAGYGYSGKTVAMQAVALSLAAGAPAWGVLTAARRRVLHIDLEQGERLTRRRYQRLARAQGIDLRELGEQLGCAIMPALSLNHHALAAWSRLMEGWDMLILDSLRAASQGIDENDSLIRGGLDMLGKASEATGCRPCVIHHARKSSHDEPGGTAQSIRGSSAIFDGCDSVHIFSGAKGEPTLVSQVKARSHGEPTEDVALVIADVEFDGDPKAGLSVTLRGHELIEQRRQEARERAAKAQAVRDGARLESLLAGGSGPGTKEIRAILRLSGDRLTAAVSHLGDRIEVREERRGTGRAAMRHYLIPSPGHGDKQEGG
jgi:hypothetical protein